jgi:hypothetical protein
MNMLCTLHALQLAIFYPASRSIVYAMHGLDEGAHFCIYPDAQLQFKKNYLIGLTFSFYCSSSDFCKL